VKHAAYNASGAAAGSARVHDNLVRANRFANTWGSNLVMEPTFGDLYERNEVFDGGQARTDNPWTDAAGGARYEGSGYKLALGATQGMPSGNILRYNVFDRNGLILNGAGMTANQIYGNVFYNSYGHVSFAAAKHLTFPISANFFRNNVYNSGAHVKLCISGGVDYDDNTYAGNNILDTIGTGTMTGATCPTATTLASLQSTYPTKWISNLSVAEGFVDPSPKSRDFSLTAASGMVDQGVFLTTVTSATGSGSSLAVADASVFTDGKGIPGGRGDLIMTAAKKTARITAITGNTLSLSKPISWTGGEGIHTVYLGTKPDIGAFER